VTNNSLQTHLKRQQGGVPFELLERIQAKQKINEEEKEVFEILVQDKTTKEIPEELFSSEKNSAKSYIECHASLMQT